MDRNTIFTSFQEISQIQDFDECFQILESVNWDLESAINNIGESLSLSNNHNNINQEVLPFNFISEGRPSNKQSRELEFNVSIREKMVTVNILDNKTVADLARLIAFEINEPNLRLKIDGFKNNHDDFTLLRDMKLPLISDIVAKESESNNFIGASSSSNQLSSETYNLCIHIYINDEFNQIMTLPFFGKDSIDKVKSRLASLTATDKCNQTWTGWPSNIFGSETTLQESGISKNITLTVHIDLDNRKRRGINEFITPSMETSLGNSREIDNEEDDYGNDIFNEYNGLMDNDIEIYRERPNSLMNSTAYLFPIEATIKFSAEFSSRYCSQPIKPTSASKVDSELTLPFFIGSIDDAISNTLNQSPHQRKPLFLYLHHGESTQADVFCTEILCYSEVCLFFIQSDYIIWPWDVTYPENKVKLMSWITRNFGSNVSSRLRIISKDEYPVIVVINKCQGLIEVMDIIDSFGTQEETVARLWNLKTKFQDEQQLDSRDWDSMQLRDLVKQEQDAAYHESLLQDQQKEKIKNNENQRIKNEEAKAILEKEKMINERRDLISRAAKALPEEPEEGPDTITIRLRVPLTVSVESSNLLTRRFLDSHSLSNLMAYVESLGFLRTEYKLLTNYPRKNLSEMTDQNVTLKELGIPKRDTLFIELL